VRAVELRSSEESLDEISFISYLRQPAGGRRPAWVNEVQPVGPPGRTGSLKSPAWTGPSQKPAGSPRAGRDC